MGLRTLLLLQTKSIGIAKYQRPLLVTIQQLPHYHLFVVNCLEKLIVFHFLKPFLKVAQHDFVDIRPSFFEQAVDEKGYGVNFHITHHELVCPLIDNRLKVKRLKTRLVF